jgi:hypothetical protein
LHIRRRFTSVSLIPIVILSSSACSQSPLVPFLRNIDRVASWAAAIRYAHDLESRHDVPSAYVKQIIRDGAVEIQTVRNTIAQDNHVPPAMKNDAVQACDQIVALLTSASVDAVDAGRLTQAEAELRALARKAGGT